jgi:molybdate transport system substrate-binding protein
MTDVTGAGDNVSWFPLPGDADATTSWITVIKGTAQDREAAQFIAEVTGPRGQQTLADDGFIAPLKTPAR